MTHFKRVSNIGLYRTLAYVLPLKAKWQFLIRQYLTNGTALAIPYFNNWFICTTASPINQSTLTSIILEGTHSQPEQALMQQLRQSMPDQMVMIDVGGNIGTFTSQFIDKCAAVYIFEPIPRLNQVIRDSIAYNKDQKITLIEKAVGDAPGTVQMLDNNNSSVVNGQTNEAILSIQVTTLDAELASLKKIDFIKIDVEGYENHVIRGAHAIVQQHKPRLLIEVHPMFLENFKEDINDILRFLDQHGYRCSYHSFLVEQRMPRWKRILSRWKGDPGETFSSREAFLADTIRSPRLLSYHIYGEPA